MKFKNSTLLKTLLLTTSISFIMPSGIALAQAPDASKTASDDDWILEDITVTATKRKVSIQTVGLSITAVSGADLQAQGAVDFEDYAISIPNLSFGATDDGVFANRGISIRGIEGFNTTGLYIDDVPLDESVDPLVLDVERVEVLRGPQGTLYGARGLGGTVRIITKQPEFDTYSGRAHVGTSHTKEGGINYVLDGAINIPIAENIAARAVVYYKYDEGIFDYNIVPLSSPGIAAVNPAAPGVLTGDPFGVSRKNVDDKRTFGGQFALRWQPSEELEFNARVFAQRSELDGYPLADYTFDPASPPSQIILDASDLTQERLFDVREGGTDQWSQISLNATYTADYGVFTSSTGYFKRTTREIEESGEFVSFTLLGPILQGAGLPTEPTALTSPITQTLRFKTFVQEARFVSNFDGPFQMTVGAFYQNTDDDESFDDPPTIAPGFDAVFSTQLNGGVPASGFTGSGDLLFTSQTTFNVQEIGLYGEFSYDITDRLSVTLGSRFYNTESLFRDEQSGFAVGGLNAVDIGPAKQSEDGFNFKGLIQFEAIEDIHFYASAAEGFRIGGSNGDLPATFGCPAQAAALGVSTDDAGTYESDSLKSYEGGVKTAWANGKMIVNAAIFHVDIKGIQQRVLLACGFDFVANIGAARSQGFELETSIRPMEGLTVKFAAGYTDAKFTETVPGLAEQGDRLQQIPKWTVSSSVDYEFRFSDERDGFIRGDFAYIGDSISRVVDSASPRLRPSYNIVNARFGLRNDKYEVAFFIDNLFNEIAVFSDNRNIAAEAFGRPRLVRNRPQTFGIDLRANF